MFYYKSHCSVTFTRFYSKHLLLSARHFRNVTFITRDVTETLRNSTKRTRRYALMEQKHYSPALKSTHQKQFFSSMLQTLGMTMKKNTNWSNSWPNQTPFTMAFQYFNPSHISFWVSDLIFLKIICLGG